MISQRIAEAYDRIANDFARINAAMPDTLTAPIRVPVSPARPASMPDREQRDIGRGLVRRGCPPRARPWPRATDGRRLPALAR